MFTINKEELLNKVGNIPQEEISLENLFVTLGEMLPEAESDPLLKARIRGLKTKHDLLAAEGKALTSTEAAKILNISRQAVDKRRNQQQLLGLSLGKRGYRYPAWQFTEEGTLPGLTETIKALTESNISDWGKLTFFLTGDLRLDNQTPLEALRSGDLEAVITAAKLYGKHSAA